MAKIWFLIAAAKCGESPDVAVVPSTLPSEIAQSRVPGSIGHRVAEVTGAREQDSHLDGTGIDPFGVQTERRLADLAAQAFQALLAGSL